MAAQLGRDDSFFHSRLGFFFKETTRRVKSVLGKKRDTSKMKWYAVLVGRKSGVYSTWEEARAQVDRVQGAVFQSFSTEEAAKEYLSGQANPSNPKRTTVDKPSAEPKERASMYFCEFYIASAFSLKTARCAWAIVCDRDLPQSSKYAGLAPEQKDRAVLCAVLRLLTRANIEERLRDKPVLLHFAHPNWPIYQSLTSWIKIWAKKRWNDGQVINLDLYKLIWPLLKTTNIAFRYHEPRQGELQQLEAARMLAEQAAHAD